MTSLRAQIQRRKMHWDSDPSSNTLNEMSSAIVLQLRKSAVATNHILWTTREMILQQAVTTFTLEVVIMIIVIHTSLEVFPYISNFNNLLFIHIAFPL